MQFDREKREGATVPHSIKYRTGAPCPPRRSETRGPHPRVVLWPTIDQGLRILISCKGGNRRNDDSVSLAITTHLTFYTAIRHIVRYDQSVQVDDATESEVAVADDTPGSLRGEPLWILGIFHEKRILIRQQTCGKRPKFVEKNGTVHPYCGRTCAKAQQSPCKLPGCRESGKSAFGGFCSPRHSR